MADFDGGAITSGAGDLLLRWPDQAIGMLERLALCFQDRRRRELIEHAVVTRSG